MQETQVWSLSREDTLKKDVATHSSILAWKVLWTEEPLSGAHRVAKSWPQLKRLSMQIRLYRIFRISMPMSKMTRSKVSIVYLSHCFLIEWIKACKLQLKFFAALYLSHASCAVLPPSLSWDHVEPLPMTCSGGMHGRLCEEAASSLLRVSASCMEKGVEWWWMARELKKLVCSERPQTQ